MKVRLCVFVALCTFFAHVLPAVAVDFPARKKPKYKNVKPIEIQQLHKDYLENKVTVVDVRSKLEYETIHIKDAFHISVADQSFERELEKLIGATPETKTAFY